MEVDLILENDDEVIVVEVKTILKVQDVNDFLADLDDFLRFFPRYAGRCIYGAVAGLTVEENAGRYAYRCGLFVLVMADNGLVQMRNDTKFCPHDFARRLAAWLRVRKNIRCCPRQVRDLSWLAQVKDLPRAV